MSNIAEQKALEAYPNKEGTVYHSFFGVLKFDENAAERRGYQKGYDQAMQDFLEKAMEYFKGKPIHHFWVEDFKNYMEEEL